MITKPIKLDISEISNIACRKRLADILPASEIPIEITNDFWTQLSRSDKKDMDFTLVISDLHHLVKYINKGESDLWQYKINIQNPCFLALICDRRDENVAEWIDDINRLSNYRISVINARTRLTGAREKDKLHSELTRIVNRHFNPEALSSVSYLKNRKAIFVEFNDGVSGEVSLKQLDLHEMAEKLHLDSPLISDEGNAVEIFTKEGEIFDIDALLLKSIITSETSNQVAEETRLTAENVGKVIRSTRHRNNMTQQELANRTNIDQAIISKIETGKHLPRFDTLSRLAEGFHISVSNLLGTD